ncbi:MAG: hypothetical protein JWM96_365, partial [Alphaproteobacteria bacterium]|nr:hypothetical protein [Alphaproteobacteria bacterium]
NSKTIFAIVSFVWMKNFDLNEQEINPRIPLIQSASNLIWDIIRNPADEEVS